MGPNNFSVPQFRLYLAHNHQVFNSASPFPTDIWLLYEIVAQVWQGLFKLSTKHCEQTTEEQDSHEAPLLYAAMKL